MYGEYGEKAHGGGPQNEPKTARTKQLRVQVLLGVVLGALAATLISLVASAAASDAAGEAAYVPLAPSRIIDTRPLPFNVGPYTTPWQPDSTRSVKVTGVGGVPADNVVSVVLNVTTVFPTDQSYLTVFPTGTVSPVASALNFGPGDIINDVVIAKVGDGGNIDIYNQAGTVALVIDVVGYHTTSLETRLAGLETLLAGMTRATVDGQDTLTLSGANLRIVDGSGSTYGTPNGTGNLIIGYSLNNLDTRTGSHNVIVGDAHSYTANGTVVFGENNATRADATSVTGGLFNTASGPWAAVSGGQENTASGGGASISGGEDNTSSSLRTSISGGIGNTANRQHASVGGGFDNVSSGIGASILGGRANEATAQHSTVSGGQSNTSSGTYSSVSGGFNRESDAINEWVAGGFSQPF